MKAIQSQNIHWLRRHTITVWVALATITLAGCSGEEVSVIERPAETAAVLFDARMISEIQSRATTMDLTTLKEEAFGVLAYYTNGYNWSNASPPNFMYNQKVNWNSTKWEYSPVKYWPIVPDDKVSFFAYAPHDDQMPATLTDNHGITLSGNTLPGAPYIDFNVNADVIADQVDLIHASAIDKNKEQVDFQFQHALSRIGFSAKTTADYGSTVVKVTALSISGTFYRSARLNLGDGTWSGRTATTNITYAPQLNAEADAIDSITQQIHQNDQYLMLIPQNFDGEGNGIVIEVTYSIDSNVTTITEEVDFHFEQSKAYTITLNISAEQSGSGLDIVVTPWENVHIQKEFTGFAISGAAWSPASREVSHNAASLRFIFTMDHPVGGTWKATLSNGLDFALDESYALTGTSGASTQVGIIALKPAAATDRTTEFYLTVDGKEVDTNNDGQTGPGHRYLITQKAAE